MFTPTTEDPGEFNTHPGALPLQLTSTYRGDTFSWGESNISHVTGVIISSLITCLLPNISDSRVTTSYCNGGKDIRETSRKQMPCANGLIPT